MSSFDHVMSTFKTNKCRTETDFDIFDFVYIEIH